MRTTIYLLIIISLLSSCGNDHDVANQTMNDAIRYVESTKDTTATKNTDSLDGCWKLEYIFYGNDRYKEMKARKIFPYEWALIKNGYLKINNRRDILVSDTLVGAGMYRNFHNYYLKSHPDIYVHVSRGYDSLYYGKKGVGDNEWSFTYKRCYDGQCSIYENRRDAK